MSHLVLMGKVRDGQLVISGQAELTDWLKRNSDEKFVIALTTLDKSKSGRLLGYWDKKVLPDLQQGFKDKGMYKTKESIETLLLASCPFTLEEYRGADGKLNSRPKELHDLNQSELSMFVSFTRMYAGENLHIFIHDPRII